MIWNKKLLEILLKVTLSYKQQERHRIALTYMLINFFVTVIVSSIQLENGSHSRRASSSNKKCCILINQYRFVPCWLSYFRTRLLEKLEKAKEEKRRRLEATTTTTSTGTFTDQARKSSVS